MSSAFDTIKRDNLINSLEGIIDEDELRMCHLLLSKTSIKLRFEDHPLEFFETNVGSPQGDGISGTFFNVELEQGLRELRKRLEEDARTSLPPEFEYADDTDFAFICNEKAKELKKIAKPTLAERNLFVNDDKTEETNIFRADEKEQEVWRKVKKLGSLLGDFEDLKRRQSLSIDEMKSVMDMFKKSKTGLPQKLKVYKSLVWHVLTYNYSTWGLSKTESEHLNRFHRKQLRRLCPSLKAKSTEELYKACHSRPVSEDMKLARWQMFGHALRLPRDAPAQLAMDWYFEIPEIVNKFKGQARITLPTVLSKDIIAANKIKRLETTQFVTSGDLFNLRGIAADKIRWKGLVEDICGIV